MEYEIKPKHNFEFGVKELWAYRELFYFFTWRDIKVKYKQAALGFLWALIQPVAMAVIFTFCFSRIIGQNANLNMPYPFFALSGMMLWNVFSSGILNAGNSMIANANIIKKIYFPRLIIPVSSILVSLFDFLISSVVLIPAAIYYKVTFSVFSPAYIIVAIILTAISTFGLGTLLAALNVKYRDFRYIIPFLVQGMLFITPVIYPVSISGNSIMNTILKLNPMSAPVELFRCAFSNASPDYQTILLSTSVSLLIFIIGLFYFRRTENYFADLA